MTAWYERFGAALTGDGDVPVAQRRDGAADARLVDAVSMDLRRDDGSATATAVRMIWTRDHLDAARRLAGIDRGAGARGRRGAHAAAADAAGSPAGNHASRQRAAVAAGRRRRLIPRSRARRLKYAHGVSQELSDPRDDPGSALDLAAAEVRLDSTDTHALIEALGGATRGVPPPPRCRQAPTGRRLPFQADGGRADRGLAGRGALRARAGRVAAFSACATASCAGSR